MPTPMPSPNGTNHAKKFLPSNWPNPTMAFDSKHGLQRDDENVRRAASFLRTKLGADGMAQFKKLLGKDQAENGETLSVRRQDIEDILDALHQLPGSEIVDKIKTMIGSLGNGETDAEDDLDIGNAPSKKEDAATIDQPEPFPGRPLRNSHATDSRRSPLFAQDTSQGDAVKRLRGHMAKIQVIG